ncbi:protein S100-A13-like [Brachyhypopomus gauderio]|uniref:protein S100-A13-like n=1 Tax=Brachyhypopomus gauderio TaxID=698409 RepID=UPI00404223CD
MGGTDVEVGGTSGSRGGGWRSYTITPLHLVSSRSGVQTDDMASQYTELELAINTLVTQFHKASPNEGPTLTVEEFQTMISKELPTAAKAAGDQEGLKQLLKEMEVHEDQGVTFKNFWKLVNTLATTQFGQLQKNKTVRCNCLLL